MKYVAIKDIFEKENENNFEEFKNFIKEFGLDDDFFDITSKHTEERLKALISAEIDGKRELAGKLLLILEEAKNKRETTGEVYSNKTKVSDAQLEKLYDKLSKFVQNYERHDKEFQHEKQIIEKWLREIENEIK